MRNLIFIIIILLTTSLTFSHEQYIEITGSDVNIRSVNNSLSTIIGKAHKGDVFSYKAKIDSWYKIVMFSGEYRFVHSHHAKLIDHEIINNLSDENILKFIDTLSECERRAFKDANTKYDVKTELYINIEYSRILIDRYKLKIFHDWKIQPILYKGLVLKYFKLKENGKEFKEKQ